MAGREITMRDVAREAGVSVAAVSRTLNGRQDEVAAATMERVKVACRKLGYRLNPVAQDLMRLGRNGRMRNIGIVIVGRDWAEAAYAEVMEGAAEHANAKGYNVALAHLTGAEEDGFGLPPILRDGRCDALLVTGALDQRILSVLQEQGKPLIVVGSYDETILRGAANVRPDLCRTAYAAMEELARTGAVQVAFVLAKEHLYAERAFYRFCVEALRSLGLDHEERLVYHLREPTTQSVHDLLEPVLLRDEPVFDALVCLDASRALDAAFILAGRRYRYGRDDVAICTFRISGVDGLPVQALYCDAAMSQCAQVGVDWLIDTLEGRGGTPTRMEIEPPLHVLAGGYSGSSPSRPKPSRNKQTRSTPT